MIFHHNDYFRSDSLFFKLDLILLLRGGIFCPNWLRGILRTVCITSSPIFIATTTVGAINNTIGLSNETFSSDKKILVNDWYSTCIRNDLLQPVLPVKKLCQGWRDWISDIDLVFIDFFVQFCTMSKSSCCFRLSELIWNCFCYLVLKLVPCKIAYLTIYHLTRKHHL